jgi:hypothetical protein
MTHAFYDDSKSFAHRGFICLCGYLSDDSGWNTFEREWRSLLACHDIKRLHTSDFLSAGGEYRERLKNVDYETRVTVVQEFIKVIQSTILFGVAVAVDSIAFRDVFRSEKKKPAPEEFCFHRVMQATLRGCEKFKDRLNLPIATVFDDSEEH